MDVFGGFDRIGAVERSDTPRPRATIVGAIRPSSLARLTLDVFGQRPADAMGSGDLIRAEACREPQAYCLPESGAKDSQANTALARWRPRSGENAGMYSAVEQALIREHTFRWLDEQIGSGVNELTRAQLVDYSYGNVRIRCWIVREESEIREILTQL